MGQGKLKSWREWRLNSDFPQSVSPEQEQMQRWYKVLFTLCHMGKVAVKGETSPLICCNKYYILT